MMYPDAILTFEKEGKSKTVYAKQKKEGAPYAFGCPRKRVLPTVPIIRMSENYRKKQEGG